MPTDPLPAAQAGAPDAVVVRVHGWKARSAALLALIAPLALALLVGIVLANRAAVAVLAAGLAIAASVALWYALIHRGALRAAGAAASAIAATGLIVILATHWHGVLVLAGVLLLLGVFALTSRFALGLASEAAAQTGARPVPRPASAVLIINPRSGGGKARRFDLAAQARRRGITPIVLEPGDRLRALAERAIASGAEVLGMAGGDGSQALVASVAAEHGVAHVCIPAGTRNHFALDLGLDRDDVVGALDAFTDGLERRIDLACVNDNVFVNNASLGVYAKVVQSEAYRDAKLATWTDMLPDLLGPDADPIDLELTGPDGQRRRDVALVLISNNPYRLTHMAGAGTRERLDTGTLGVVVAQIHDPRDVARLMTLELVGQIERFPGLTRWAQPDLDVDSGSPVEVGLDGEALVLEPPLHFSSLPGALRVRVPPGAGVAPAARSATLTTDTLGELLRVAAGR